MEAIGDGEDPFRKRGLRRSPQADTEMKLDLVKTSDKRYRSPRALENTRSNKRLKVSQQDPQATGKSTTKTLVGFHKESRHQNLRTKYKPSIHQKTSINLSDSLFVSPNSSIKSILHSGQDTPLNPSDLDLPYSNVMASPIKEYFESNKTRESLNMPFQDLIQYPQKNKNKLRNTRDISPESLQQNHDGIFDKRNTMELSSQLCSIETAGTSSILDSHKAKRALKRALLQEIKQLKEDIALADSENERLRLTGTGPKIAPFIDEKVLSMLTRATCPRVKIDRKMNKKTILQSLHNFLPFSSGRSRLPRSDAQSVSPYKINMPSFLPQAVENPLPYLQAFTPLIWSSKITTIRLPRKLATSELEKETSSKKIELFQQQIITASHSQGLFFARLALHVDPNSRGAHQLLLLNIPLCAEHELGSFIRSSKKQEDYRDSEIETVQISNKDLLGAADSIKLVNREIGVVCYAMGRWLQVSLHRAKFWWLVSKHFSTPEARERFIPLYTFSKTRRTKNSKDSGKKRKRLNHGEKGIDYNTDNETIDFNEENNQNFEENDNLFENEATKSSGNWIRKELLPHLGRSFLCISKNGRGSYGSKTITNSQYDSDFEILFEWRLSFDWTGEIKSHLTATPKVPESWCKSLDKQTHNGFDQIPHIFQGLLREKGPVTAVACLISLTMVEEEQ